MFKCLTGKRTFSLDLISFLQALGVLVYCGLVGLLMWRGEQFFGPIHTPLEPILFVVLFTTSALICGLLVLGYPIYLFWDRKKTAEALRLVGLTAGWLIIFVLLIILALLLS